MSPDRSEEEVVEENLDVDRARAYATPDPHSDRIFFNKGEQ